MLVALAPMLAAQPPALADPPPWAPAHGYHKPGKHKYKAKYDRRDDRRELLPWLAGAATGGYLIGNRCNRAAIGAAVGGVIGGVVGSQIGDGDGRKVATIAGALIGVLAGQAIGRSMDRADEYCTGQALEYAPDQQTVTWNNPDALASYEVTPISTYESRDGRYCREYSSQATIAGRNQQTYGTACRQADGSWEVVRR
jgi:surface antigen